MIIYDKEGKSCEMHSIDAKECIEHCGYTLEPPIKVEPLPKEIKTVKPKKGKLNGVNS